MKKVTVIFSILLLAACSNKEKSANVDIAEKTEVPQKKFEMYAMSEMSTLMEKLYSDNRRVRKNILADKEIGPMPNYYEKLFSSKMTDPAENDAFFKAMATSFVSSQKLIYENAENRKIAFNNSINVCIECHKAKCLGPIPRIKKLLIN